MVVVDGGQECWEKSINEEKKVMDEMAFKLGLDKWVESQ